MKKKPAKTRPVGRPTKYKPEMCERVIGFLAQGMSLVEASVNLGISEETLHVWKKEKPEFSESIKVGLQQSQAWWERLGREHIVAETDEKGKVAFVFNSASWFQNMKNRFKHDWRDQQEVAHTGADGGPIAIQAFPKCETPQEYIEWQKQQDPPKLKLIE